MKNSRNKQDIEEKLMKKFKISSLQAREIAEMPMYKISKEWHEKFKNEIDKLDDFIFENESKIRNKFLIDKEIMNEMDEIVKKYEPKLFKAVNNIFADSYEYTRKYREFYKKKNDELKSKKSSNKL